MHQDSVNKIMGYLKASQISEVVLSPMFFRDYTCPEKCGACCPRFSLDYWGKRWEKFNSTYPELVEFFKMRKIGNDEVFSDFQNENKSHFCKYLNMEPGRCKIHEVNPFSCEFELIKFYIVKGQGLLTKKQFGRKWMMLRVDEERGTLCDMLPFNINRLERDIELLEELEEFEKLVCKKQGKLPWIIGYLRGNLHKFRQGNIPETKVVF